VTTDAQTEETVPTYIADGRRCRDYGLAACKRMEKLGMMVLERNRRGKIVCATFRPEEQDSYTRRNPLRQTIPTGSYHSREELIGNHWVWQFRPGITLNELSQVMGKRAECEDLDIFVRTVSRAVALSCINDPGKPRPDDAAKAAMRVSLGDRKGRIAAQRKRGKRSLLSPAAADIRIPNGGT
jgi:hypothetical protein